MRALLFFFLVASGLFLSHSGFAHEFSGSASFEPQFFFEDGAIAEQERYNLSGTLKPEYSHSWDDGRQVFTFLPFFRIDQFDNERTHFDIRELNWIKAYDEWEFRVGIGKVFWGVTESQHLVDVINQTDFVEGVDGEEKLGQPMLSASWTQDSGTLDFFVLPYFRERTFRGSGKNRFRFTFPVDTDQATFESSAKENHVDVAIRWSHSVDEWDMALSYFVGTSREPQLNVGTNASGATVFIPHYFQMRQTGIELQRTIESWLLKFEGLFRGTTDKVNDASAFTAGFEYTFYGVIGAADLGALVEYHYDDRGAAAFSGLQNDIFLGSRLAVNDEDSTEVLAGIIFDFDDSPKLYFVESSRRLTENLKLSAEVRGFIGIPANDFLFAVRKDSYLQVDLEWFF